MMFGKFIDSSTVTGTQIRLDNNQYLRGRNFANTGDLNILKITTSNLIEFKQIPYVEGQGRLALYSEIESIQVSVEYLYGQLTEVTGDIATIQGDIVDIQAEIDALQEEVGDFALKDLSNLTPTSIPSGVNLESLSIVQSQVTGFLIKTRNQTTSVSGSVAINTGTSTGAFASGFVNLVSGSSSNAVGALSTTTMTGAALLSSGSVIGGTRGSSGGSFVRSGGVAVISSPDTYTGNSGTVGVIGGVIQSSFNGATVTGGTGFASLASGGIIATVSGATASGNSGNVLVSSGGFQTFVVGAVVSGNSGSVSLQSGGVSGVGTSTVNTGSSTLTTGVVTNANNVGSTGTASMSTGQNAGIGNSGSVSISTGNVTNPLTTSINFSGAISAVTGKSIRATSGPIVLQTGEISPFGFNNESNVDSFTGVFSVTTGAINSALNTGSTGEVLLSSGSHNGLGNTGAVNIFSGSQTGTGNSGDVNVYTGNNTGTGFSGNINVTTGTASNGVTRGRIGLDGQITSVLLTTLAASGDNSFFNVQNTQGLSSFQVLHYAEEANNSVGIRIFESSPTSGFSINGWGQDNQNGGPFSFRSTKAYTSSGGSFNGGDFNIIASSTDYIAPSVDSEISSGNVNISTQDAFVSGTGANANTGSINLTTGISQGTGTRGIITLDGDYVSASSSQIKDVADPTDPQDALTLNYFNNNIPSVAALDFYPLQAYNTYATIYADGTAGVLDPVTPTNPRPGWYFKNSAGSPQKINWYFFDGAVVSCQLQNFAAFAVVTLDSIASLPYFIFYTFPTGSGDVIPGFAHSQVVYSNPYVPSAVVGTKYLIYFGAEPDVFPYLPRIELTYNAAASGGDQGATELVSTCAFSTESGASANNVQVMVENLGLNLSNFKAYFDLLIFPVFQESQDFYGSFYSSQTQDNLIPDVARAMTFNNTAEANGVSIVSNSRITFNSEGMYNIQFSAQLSSSRFGPQNVDIWLSKNGTNIPFTNSRETLGGIASVISAWNFFERVNAGDYVEIYWSSPSDDVIIEYIGTQTGPTRPETPSIILTVNKIIS